MSQNLQQLVSPIGVHVAKNIVQAQILYPHTDKLLLDNGMLEIDFNGTFLTVIPMIESLITLKANDAV